MSQYCSVRSRVEWLVGCRYGVIGSWLGVWGGIRGVDDGNEGSVEGMGHSSFCIARSSRS